MGIPVNIQLYQGVDDVITSTFLHGELHGDTLIIGDINPDENGFTYKSYFYDKEYEESIKLIENNKELVDAVVKHILNYVFEENE